MQNLFSILECENPRQAQFFSAEKAIDILPLYFNKIEQYIYHNAFKINNVSLLINYIRSLPNMDKKNEAFYSRCEEKLNAEIKNKGYIELYSDQYLFIVKK